MLNSAANDLSNSGGAGNMVSLYDIEGCRKYVTLAERNSFLEAARRKPPEIHTFCRTLATTGARISEVLSLTPHQFDFAMNIIVVQSLKKRSRGIYRAVPVPSGLLEELDQVHHIRQAQCDPRRSTSVFGSGVAQLLGTMSKRAWQKLQLLVNKQCPRGCGTDLASAFSRRAFRLIC